MTLYKPMRAIYMQCKYCGKEHQVLVDCKQFDLFVQGTPIEKSIPTINNEDKIWLQNNCCPNCYNKKL